MTKLMLSVENAAGMVLASASEEGECWLVYEPEYAPGDCLSVSCGQADQFLMVCLDDALAPALVYCKGTQFSYPIPFEEARSVFSPRAFSGKRHYLHVRLAAPCEIAARRNLALNPWATHAPAGPYPYASANVETRGEMVFAAKNAIDGMKANTFHGEWPYTSWGINRDPRATWTLEFGRVVELDEAVFYLRADFPHDAWWESADLSFSDGSRLTVPLKKTAAGQHVPFPPRKTEWVRLDGLRKADDPSPFPALTQLELWGHDLCQEDT